MTVGSSLTFSPLPFIAPSRYSKLHFVCVHIGMVQVFADRPKLVRLCADVNKRTSLMGLSLFLQQFLTCLVHSV